MKTAEAIALDRTERQSRFTGIPPAKRKCLAVLTPTLGNVSMWWHTALVDLIWPMNTGKGFIPVMDQKGGEIGEMRNRLVSLALQFEEAQGIDLEYLMWIDDDVIVGRMALLALAQHDRDIASGVYFSKNDMPQPLIFDGPSSGTARWEPDKLLEKWGWAQGLSLVRLAVYKRMRDELNLGVDKYGNPAWFKEPEFGKDEQGNITLGGTEDFHFFENASKLGYRPLIDCSKHAFGWHYDAALKTGYPKRQWEQYVRREPIVWPLKDGGEVVWE